MHLVITSKSADKQFFMFFMYSFFFCIVLALHATSADILYAAAVTVTPYIACKFCLPSKNNEGDVNPRQFFIDPKLTQRSQVRPAICQSFLAIISFSSVPTPEITFLHNICHSSHHDYVALSLQNSESLLPHIPPLSHQNFKLDEMSWSSAQFSQVNHRNWGDRSLLYS